MCTPRRVSPFKDGLTSIYELTWIEERIEERYRDQLKVSLLESYPLRKSRP